MASQNKGNDKIPMGKAIAIICSVILGAVVFAGGIGFAMLNVLNPSNDPVAATGSVNISENLENQIIGEWRVPSAESTGSRLLILYQDNTVIDIVDVDSVLFAFLGTWAYSGNRLTLNYELSSVGTIALEQHVINGMAFTAPQESTIQTPQSYNVLNVSNQELTLENTSDGGGRITLTRTSKTLSALTEQERDVINSLVLYFTDKAAAFTFAISDIDLFNSLLDDTPANRVARSEILNAGIRAGEAFGDARSTALTTVAVVSMLQDGLFSGEMLRFLYIVNQYSNVMMDAVLNNYLAVLETMADNRYVDSQAFVNSVSDVIEWIDLNMSIWLSNSGTRPAITNSPPEPSQPSITTEELDDEPDANPVTPEPEPVATPTPPQNNNENILPIQYETFVFRDLEITLGNVVRWDVINNRFSDLDGYSVFALPVHVRNIGDDSAWLNATFFRQFNPSGIVTRNINAQFPDTSITNSSLFLMRSGASVDAYIYFLYEGDGDYIIEFSRLRETHEFVIPNIIRS